MKKVTALIYKGKEQYGSALEHFPGFYGAGDTVAEAKESLKEAIKLYIEYNTDVPEVLLGDYELVYKMDAQSLLEYYKGIISNAALERLTGINQRQLQHYASGRSNPRPAQLKKIENALHSLGRELIAVKL